MGWGKFTHKLRNSAKKGFNKIANGLGMSGKDLGAIALSPFTAGASLLGTSSAKSMLKNPMGTLMGGVEGLAEGGPMGAFLGAMEGGGGWDAMFGGNSSSSGNASSKAIAEQYKYQMMLQKDAQAWQKGMSDTAHQREVADLENAGLNPILSANAGASTGSVGAGSVGMPDKVAEKTAEMQNKIAQLSLKNELATSAKERQLLTAETLKTITEASYTNTLDKNAGTKTQAMKNDEAFANTWWGKNISPALRDIFGGGGAATGAVAGAAVSQAATSAKKARVPKRNKIGF